MHITTEKMPAKLRAEKSWYDKNDSTLVAHHQVHQGHDTKTEDVLLATKDTSGKQWILIRFVPKCIPNFIDYDSVSLKYYVELPEGFEIKLTQTKNTVC